MALLASFALVTGCGGPDAKQVVRLGNGFTVEVDQDLQGRDLILAVSRAAQDQLDLTAEAKECVNRSLAQVPESEFQRLLSLPLSQQSRAGFAINLRYARNCGAGPHGLLVPNASHRTVMLLKPPLEQAAAYGFARGLRIKTLPKSVAACIKNPMDAMSDQEFIAFVNSSPKAQALTLRGPLLACLRSLNARP